MPADATDGGKRSGVTRIIAFGDSTTAPRGELVVFADLLAQELPKRGMKVEVINSGVPGNNTEQARERFEKDVLARKPDAVVLWFGLNDAAVDVYLNATEPRVSLERYENNLRSFVRQLREKGIAAVLMTPNPMTWTKEILGYYGKAPYRPEDPDGMNVVMGPYVEAVRRTAREERAALVDAFQAFRDAGTAAEGGMDEFLLDGMHPNNAGHRLVANLLMPYFLRNAPR